MTDKTNKMNKNSEAGTDPKDEAVRNPERRETPVQETEPVQPVKSGDSQIGGRIKMLSPATVDKIAAGEVILRPVSVVKELCENAFDAGASHVEIEVEKGGKRLIRIADDGIGIRYNEVPLAFQRHATSKISFPDDLDVLTTLGFRGEALSSIAAVAEVELTTRFRDEEIGSRTIFSGGVCLNHAVAAYDRGTEVRVSDLFADVPVRSKYLRKDDEEETQIRRTAERLALSHPEVAITYISDGKKIFRTPGTGDLHAAAGAVLGRSIAKNLHPFRADNEPMKLYGLIGDLELRRSHRGLQIFFVNGRCVKSPVLTRAYEQAWEGLLMKHQYPAGIICLDLPPKMLDVNIHPQKTEIRILNETLAVLLFRQGIRSALKDLDLTTGDAENSPSELRNHPESEGSRNNTAVQSGSSVMVPQGSDLSSAEHENAYSKGEETEASPKREATEEQTAAAFAKPVDLEALLSEPEPDAPWISKYFPEEKAAETQSEYHGGAGGQKPSGEAAARTPAAVLSGSPETGHRTQENGTAPISSAAADGGAVSETEEADRRETESAEEAYERILAAYGPQRRRLDRPDLTKLKVAGRLFNTYILLEDRDTLLMIDQHAAHEAMLFEEFRQIFSKRTGFPMQSLMIPRQIAVSKQEAEAFEKHSGRIRSFGFDAELFGEDRVAVRAVPVILGEPQDAGMILPVIALFDSGTDAEQGLDRIITMSCKAAVKGGQNLTDAEIRRLTEGLMELDNPYTCPHGRPVIMKLNEHELRKLFKRIV